METERFDAVVIGAGQAGLTAGYYLQRAGRSFVILDGNERVGDNWRHRYDSLKLFTPPRYIGPPGMRYAVSRKVMPTKDQMADHLEAYAQRMAMPVRTGVRVDGVRRDGDTYVVSAGEHRLETANVIVASGAHRMGRVPAIAGELDPRIVQMHSVDYRNPSQLQEGPVLVVGAGNSGADISLEVAATHETHLAGPIRGHVPVDIDGGLNRFVTSRIIVFAGLHVVTSRNPLGRKVIAKASRRGDPLIRVKPKQLEAAGVRRIGKVVAVENGLPKLEDGRVLDVTNVVWCTGFRHDLSWIDLPIFGEDGAPIHERGVVTSEPGLYFVGLPLQFSLGSDAIPGVGRDAAYVVKQIGRRSRRRQTAEVAVPVAA
jgi:putative flavoprotein involved in K+ transport